VIHGSRASLIAQGIEGDVAVVEPRRSVTLEVALPKVDLHRNFYEAIVQEAPLQVTSAQALRVSRLVDACLESSSGGRATRVAI
jgi:predicted dehydrogenase